MGVVSVWMDVCLLCEDYVFVCRWRWVWVVCLLSCMVVWVDGVYLCVMVGVFVV